MNRDGRTFLGKFGTKFAVDEVWMESGEPGHLIEPKSTWVCKAFLICALGVLIFAIQIRKYPCQHFLQYISENVSIISMLLSFSSARCVGF